MTTDWKELEEVVIQYLNGEITFVEGRNWAIAHGFTEQQYADLVNQI